MALVASCGDTILGFGILYQAEPALDHLRILSEGSLVVVLSIELDYKLWATLYKRASLVLANRWLVALCEQRVGHILHISKPGGYPRLSSFNIC
jgi:hypothetical protein